MKYDIVIPLGGGSIWDNNELRYCLRSIQKHLSNYGDIYLVGEKPNWIKNVIHFPFEDKCMQVGEHLVYFKERCIFDKTLHASKIESLSENFIFFNDDHFLLSDFDALTFPYFYKNNLQTAGTKKYSGKYKRALMNTYTALVQRNLPTLNYDGHQPIVYNKYQIQSLADLYDWNIEVGYVLKSLYSNTVGVQPVYEPDCKLNSMMYPDAIRESIKGKKIFSIGNPVLQQEEGELIGGDMKTVMEELYPTPSYWEK